MYTLLILIYIIYFTSKTVVTFPINCPIVSKTTLNTEIHSVCNVNENNLFINSTLLLFRGRNYTNVRLNNCTLNYTINTFPNCTIRLDSYTSLNNINNCSSNEKFINNTLYAILNIDVIDKDIRNITINNELVLKFQTILTTSTNQLYT